MNDRLSALDVSFLYLEGESTPMHVGGLAVFDPPPGGFDYARFVRLVEDRISLVPRYRQKIKSVPGHIGYPVWVDDSQFDVSFHVRRSALPRPGSDQQLRELVARLQSRPLDRSRPLWEMNVVEGLAGGGFAIITKTHHAMVDGISAIDLAQVILDPTPHGRAAQPQPWRPRGEPGPVDLVVDAVRDLISRPGAVVDTIRMGVNDARATTVKLVDTVSGLLSAARVAARPAPSTPLNATIGAQRRFAVARTTLSDYKTVRSHGQGTVNDVVLATVAGALRGWLMARGRAVTPTTTVRAMVPLSVRTGPASELGNRVSSYLVDLPVGEPNPLVRLTQISYAMAAHKESGQSVGADALIALSGFAPPTLHALGARAANSFTRRLFNLVVTNVPGPQFPLFADGAQLREMFPIVPLAGGQAVSIGLTSYDGNVFFGLNGDRDAMGDVDTLAMLIEESLAELVAAVKATATAPGRAVAGPLGRAKPKRAGPGRPVTRQGTDAKPARVTRSRPGLPPAVRTDAGPDGRRALVFGGGGVLGFAWTVGALRALEVEWGVDANAVALNVGTSAGSTLAALLGCGIKADVIRRHHQGVPAPADPTIEWDYHSDSGGALPPWPGFVPGSPRLLIDAVRHPMSMPAGVALSGLLPRGRGTLEPIRAVISAAIAAGAVQERTGSQAGVAGATPGPGRSTADDEPRGMWPTQPQTWIVATDYDSGARVVFGRDHAVTGPVDLGDAVAASCAIPAWYSPVPIGGRLYIDGGTASNASADLVEPLVAAGAVDEVIILAPMASVEPDRPRSPIVLLERAVRRVVTRGIEQDASRLRAAGARVVVLTPGPYDLDVMGGNLMNPRRRTEVLETSLLTSATALRELRLSNGIDVGGAAGGQRGRPV